MKNLFQKNARIIAATTSAVIITISMSFKAQEKIEGKSNETAYSIEKINAISKNAKNLSALSAAPAVMAAISGLESGYSNTHNEIAANSPINIEIAKVSQFD
ncbi:hypothetical protein D1632_12280 [Chryseobacterium nematophagum]|uniref:Uncharacterized protein n=1 Tax=Chryseobacterium nematophagum TaxID=2305228 RepID=A0A3M7LA21_9FLAO|nr:hypothetical protein [Chryseobacterium nematophagum]RMZ58392.1 hypothetical protein D1632_12280 [Chryseobacterium nematophagum]